MKICVPCADPGGPEAPITDMFEESEVYDYYELQVDGRFEHIAQARHCLGGCADPVDTVIGRGARAVIVIGILPSSLHRFLSGGVRVCLTRNPSVRVSMDAFAAGELEDLTIGRAAEASKLDDEGG